MKIGFFDSGLGGLIILKAVAKDLPDYDYIFYGDTENLPYGDKDEDEIYSLTVKGVEYLFESNCSIVIVACNTSSAETLKKIQDEFLPIKYPDRKVLGVIIPTIESLVYKSLTEVLLLATKRTIDSQKYSKELNLRGHDNVILTELATPELVPMIESGELELAIKAAVVRIDSVTSDSRVVVLGCSHYSQIKNQLREHYSGDKIILSQDEIIPVKFREYINKHRNLGKKLSNTGERTIHLTKHRPDYDLAIGQFLGGQYIEE